jgi:ribose 5-phosphate isomerase RpiB
MLNSLNIFLFSHPSTAYAFKQQIKKFLTGHNYIILNDIGPHDSDEGISISELCTKLTQQVLVYGNDACGLILTQTGIEAFICCNKFPGIRCAKVHDYYTAKMSK